MAKAKRRELLDWHGDPIPGVCRGTKSKTERIEKDSDGVDYWISPDGTERVPLKDFYLKVEDGSGTVLYDSRCDPPQVDSV
jgi:hypothetical protein